MKKLSLSLALLAALAALALLATSCKKDEKPASSSSPAGKADPGGAEPAKTAPAAAPAAAKADQPAPTAGEGPIPECNAIMAKLEPCFAKVAGENVLKKSHDIMKQSAREFSPDAPEALKKQFADTCKTYYDGIKTQAEQICPGVSL